MLSQIPRTETLEVELSDKVQRQRSVLDENVPLPIPLGSEESRFAVVSREEKNGDKRVSCKQKHKVNHANMADSMNEMV